MDVHGLDQNLPGEEVVAVVAAEEVVEAAEVAVVVAAAEVEGIGHATETDAAEIAETDQKIDEDDIKTKN